MSEFFEAVRQFDADVEAAVSRARKASHDSADRAEVFRAQQAKINEPKQTPAEREPEPDPDAPQQRKSSVKQTWPERRREKPKLIGDDDDDFSQGSVLS